MEERIYEELNEMTLAQIYERLDEENSKSAHSAWCQLESAQQRVAGILNQSEMDRLEDMR